MLKRIGARLGFLASSVFAFLLGFWATAIVLLVCSIIGYYRVCGIFSNLFKAFIPYKVWSDSKPQGYSYKKNFIQCLKRANRFLFNKQNYNDISIQDSLQFSFRDMFSATQEKQAMDHLEDSMDEHEGLGNNLYGDWKESNDPNYWKLSK